MTTKYIYIHTQLFVINTEITFKFLAIKYCDKLEINHYTINIQFYYFAVMYTVHEKLKIFIFSLSHSTFIF